MYMNKEIHIAETSIPILITGIIIFQINQLL